MDTLELQQTVGYVPDEAKKDGSLVPFYERSVCAAAFSPDGQLLIAVGCDDQHTIGVWKWAKGQLLCKSPGLRADPPGVHQLAIAPLWGGWRNDAATQLRVWSEEQSLMLVTVGTGNAPKFWSLLPPQTQQGKDPWTLPLGKVAGGMGEPPPKSLSSVAFGGATFASPSGVPWGLTLVGGGGGRIFLIDAPTSLAVLRMIQAHAGPVTALTATAAGVVSGGGDGAVKLWRKTPGKNEVELVHTYSFGGEATGAGAVRGPGEASAAMAAIMTNAPKRQSGTSLPKALRNAL